MQGNRPGAAFRTDASFGIDPPACAARTPFSYLTADEADTDDILVIHTDENSSNIPRSCAGHGAARRTEPGTAGMPLLGAWMVPSEVRTDPVPFTGDAGNREAVPAYRTDDWPEGLENTRDEWAQVLGNPASLTARAARELAGAFQHPTARDCLMTDVITSAPDQFTSVMLGVFPARPDWARVDTAQEVAFELMKGTPEGQRAPMLCVIGWLEWLKGRSSFASRYFKLALHDAPNYRLAVLLAEHVSCGLVAACARNPEISYASLPSRVMGGGGLR